VEAPRWGVATTRGCPTSRESCALDWAFTQDGNDVTIVVDREYRIDGRLCGDQLYLRGGWWLPVVDEDVGSCTYEDDSAEEVGILEEGNVLTVLLNAPLPDNPNANGTYMTGTLQVQGRCAGQYEVIFQLSPTSSAG